MGKIKIFTDTDKGCILFEGSTVEPKFINTCVASIHPNLSDRIIIKRTDRFQGETTEFRTIFRKLKIDRIENEAGEELVADLGMDRDAIVSFLNTEFNKSLIQLTTEALTEYDLYACPTYTGNDSDGSSLKPYLTIQDAIDNSSANDTILLKGEFVITADIVLPHALNFYGSEGTEIKYASFDAVDRDIIKFTGTGAESLVFENIVFRNAGAYGMHIINCAKVRVEDCEFYNNGWDGTALNTVLPSSVSGVLGYDSTNTELQAFYAGSNAYNGGAMRLEVITQVELAGNKAQHNLRGFRVQDCGVNGYGFITRNIASQNIESGIYLAAGSTYYGCQNIVVSINSSAYNANNGLLVIGGLNNKFSQNEINGNWNAGVCMWGAANTTLRDCGLYDNNRSQYNGIGNEGDAKASIQINEIYNLLGTNITLNPAARFIAEILDTQVHYTGLGSNTDKIGFLITSAVGDLADNAKNIIKVDDVGFIGQDYAIDFSEVDLTNLRVSLGDNSYQTIGQKAVKAPLAGNYSELPFSNHVMEVPEVDVVVDTLKQTIALHEGVGGNVINVYKINELSSVLKNNSIDIIQKSSNKIQLRDCTLGNTYVNGVVAGSNINTMNDSLNAAFNMDLTEYKEFIETEVGVTGADDSATFYYIESPDGTYHYPLFKSEAEANQVDTDLGGSGTSHTHTYVDDLTGTTWYMPDVSNHMNSSDMPVNGLYTAPNGESVENVVWNIQVTDTDSNYLPTFTNITYNVQEGSAINIQYKAAGMTETFNITGIPTGYADNGFAIIGTAEDITNGYGQSVTHVLNITKANNFGSVQGTITINVKANLTGNEFTLVDDNGSIKFTQDGGATVLDFNTVTFNAGSTYKFYLDGSTLQTNDVVNLVDANGNGILGNDGLTQIGTGAGYAGTHFQYAIPSDVPPGKFITFTDGSTSTTYADVPLTIAGSTYTTTVTGVTAEGPTANFTGTVIDTGTIGWLSIDDDISVGQRLVLDSAFITDLHESMPDYSIVWVGFKADNWTNTSNPVSSFKGLSAIRFYKTSAAVGESGIRILGYANGGTTNQIYTASLTNAQAFIEVTNSGNNIRVGHTASSSYNATTDTYLNWDSNSKVQTGEQGYGITTLEPVVQWDAINNNIAGWDFSDVDWTGLSEISVPTAPTMETNWTKAIDFSGGNEYLKQVNTSNSSNALRMNGLSQLAGANSDSSKTSNDTYSRPWATAIVFQTPNNSSNQHIWNSGEGTGNNADNIYLRIEGSNGSLYFGWGREGVGYNEYHILNIGGSYNQSTGQWWGIYIAHKGQRFNSSNATAANLVDAFDIRLMGTNDTIPVFDTLYDVGSTASNWTSTGVRMDRTMLGDFTIGGRGANRSFHGKVASMVITTLRKNYTMPTDAEIKLMLTDPLKWEEDYKEGKTARYGYSGANFTYSSVNANSRYATQIWLMGDGTSDSYANGVRNQVYHYDQNYTKLQFNSMQSNDIVNININGLS